MSTTTELYKVNTFEHVLTKAVEVNQQLQPAAGQERNLITPCKHRAFTLFYENRFQKNPHLISFLKVLNFWQYMSNISLAIIRFPLALVLSTTIERICSPQPEAALF